MYQIKIPNYSKSLALIAVIFFMGILTTSCAMLPPETQTAQEQSIAAQNSSKPIKNVPGQVQIDKLEPNAKALSQVELIWASPEQPVDGFVIHYGDSKENLSKQIKLPIDSLEKVKNSDTGLSVYRYILSDPSTDTILFIALTAYIGNNASQLSEVIEVKQ